MQDNDTTSRQARREAAEAHNAEHDERRRVRHAAIRMTPLAQGMRPVLLSWRREEQARVRVAEHARLSREAEARGLAGVTF